MEGRLHRRSRLGLCLCSLIERNAPARRGLQTTGWMPSLAPHCPDSPNRLLLSVGSLAGGQTPHVVGLGRNFQGKAEFLIRARDQEAGHRNVVVV
ncbi:hypothetical protein MRX96_054955 [Rhipicephalus microplus]